ncbi:MAG: tetratricopeptide repeat protein, partial [Anaerolineales bacterium]
MEKVFLRVYNREIASMIEGGHLDEAVAHCQHILKTFPMHIETYRLLGKAFLEGRRYTDAADIFQRILMSVPDDFVSQVGMSVIRDNEGRLDDVIWHMERAFEVQPSNSAIQGELRRLYGRRDGVEPPKIRLSRDALANMYLQGELFNQAIAEIRSILAEDPNRPDLQVMLLRAYYNSGQKVEASEMAATLLKKYHYCMDALRVLVDVLPDAKSAENTQVYRRRLYLLDPYSSFAIDSVFASDQVADSAVDLERLDYKASAMPGTSQTDQTSSPGIKMNTEKRTEPAPDSLQTSETVEPSGAVIPEPSGVGATAAAGTVADSVPDANRPSGHLDSTGKTKDGSADTGNALPEKPIAKPIIPDWLMPMAPTEIVEKANTMSEESSKSLPAGDDGFPDWFTLVAALEGAEGAQVESQGIISSPEGGKDINPIAPVEPAKEALMKPQESLEPQPASGEDVPDSLRTIAPVETAPETLITHPEPVKPQGESTLPAEATGTSNIVSEPTLPNVPPKESEAEPVPAATPSADEKPFPDWLTGMGTAVAVAIPSAAEAIGNPAEGGQPIAEQPVSEQAVAEQPVPEQSIPEKSVSEQAVTEQSVPEQPVSEQTVADQPVA